MSGWFAVKRGTLEHEMFAPTGKWSRYEAWSWMIEQTPYADGEVTIKGKTYATKRGHFYHSIRFMAGKFKWSEKAVRTFIAQLEKHGAVKRVGAHSGAHFGAQLCLCNYDKYQAKGHTQGRAQGHKEEQVKQIPVGTADKSAIADPKKIAFDSGVALLGDAGISERKARAIIGKWVNNHGPEIIISALSTAKREGAIEPVSFIEATLRFQKKTKPQQRDGYVNAGAFGNIPERA